MRASMESGIPVDIEQEHSSDVGCHNNVACVASRTRQAENLGRTVDLPRADSLKY